MLVVPISTELLRHFFVMFSAGGFRVLGTTRPQMKIGPADGTGGNLDDGIPRVLNLRIRNGINTDVAFATGAEGPRLK